MAGWWGGLPSVRAAYPLEPRRVVSISSFIVYSSVSDSAENERTWREMCGVSLTSVVVYGGCLSLLWLSLSHSEL